MLHIISLGAGVQSTTMALMAARGEIGPMPDCAIFADTQAEPLSVYHHLDWLEPLLPFPVYRVTHGNLAKDGLKLKISQRSGRQYQKNLIPLFMLSPKGERGMLVRKCTSEYKVRCITKQVRKLVTPEAIRAWRKAKTNVAIVEQWIGISSDEVIRMKPAKEGWTQHRWPLIEMNVSRDGCLRWMEKNGYPRPPRSACVFCPYHNDTEWRRLRDDEPEEFKKAVDWEREAHKANAQDEAAHGRGFLHASRVPLDQVDFSTAEDRGQLDLFNNECEGMCGV